MDQPEPRTVLFDLDGTLMDSAAGIIASFRHALAAVGAAEPDPEVTEHVAGPPMRDTLASLGLEGDVLERALAAYSERYDSVGWLEASPFPGVPELLQRLTAAGLRLGLATSKAQPRAVRVLEHFGLARYFTYIGGASPDGSRRAKADVIAHSLTNLGPAPDVAGERGVVMVGDRVYDVEGAAAFGVPTLYVTWGYGLPDESRGALRRVDTLDGLADLLLAHPDHSVGDALHVTFVCTGNICRSPMAEKIFAEHLRRAGLASRVRVSSAGTSGWHVGAAADRRTVDVLAAHGYPVDHCAAEVDGDLLDADLIVAMDSGHQRTLTRLGADPDRVQLLRSFDPAADGPDVDDPYYGDPDDFDRVRREIEAAVPALVDWVHARL